MLTTPSISPAMTTPRLPALYLPHGGGPSFFMTGPRKERYLETEMFLRGLAQTLPAKPKAILVVTSHWETAVPSFTGGANPGLIFDYYGFPPETYQLEYKAPGSPELAARAAELMQQAGLPARVDPDYGWDHGVFIFMKVAFPDADIPVVAMSLHHSLHPELHSRFGEVLAPLRDEGVLIIGAGMSYHNLGQFNEFAAESFEFHDLGEQRGGRRPRHAHTATRAMEPRSRRTRIASA
jgi:aromatic ring-opening dioxygenase catalytic subunit (LigB family)